MFAALTLTYSSKSISIPDWTWAKTRPCHLVVFKIRKEGFGGFAQEIASSKITKPLGLRIESAFCNRHSCCFTLDIA